MLDRRRSLLARSFFLCVWSVTASGAETADRGESYLAAVRTFADRVIAEGRDRYGPRHTPLFVDGLNVETQAPAAWKFEGREWILSNQASQQYLFRTLNGLTQLTGEPRYRNAAVEAMRYQFEHLRAPNGLMYWGGHCAYDAGTEELVGEKHGGRFEHELKRHYPYYELMWEVDPEVTRKYIEAFWGAHIVDWSNLCMNRHGRYDRRHESVWSQEYAGGPVFFPCAGLTFVSTGSDLYYAAAVLSHLSGRKEPLEWARRMAHRYVETRNPRTGLTGYQYTQYKSGDRARKQFGAEWGDRVLEGTLLIPEQATRQFGDASVSELMLGQWLGEAGRDFQKWGLEDLAAYARHAYNPADNTFCAMITDGTKLSPADVKRAGYFGPEGSSSFAPARASADLLRAYAMAYAVSGDAFFWQITQSIARGLDLGDIGATPETPGRLNLKTSCSDPNALLALLELNDHRASPGLLELARRIGTNILEQRFHRGLFVADRRQVFAKFDAIEPLALLRLVATLRDQRDRVPRIPPGKSYFHCEFDGLGRTYDNAAIYGQREP